jgi:CO/xanthine dehydrogenase FAD-binding subunit
MMRPFSYERATDVAFVFDTRNATPETMLLAGGTTLLDLMKLDVMMPNRLIDITGLATVDPALAELRLTANGGLAIGALARMSAVAEHPLVRSNYPVTEHGHHRRQSVAAHALRLFPRRHDSRMQQAQRRIGLRRATRR